jgi:hypothetical protein
MKRNSKAYGREKEYGDERGLCPLSKIPPPLLVLARRRGYRGRG